MKKTYLQKLSELNVEYLAFMEIIMELEGNANIEVTDESLSGDLVLNDCPENNYNIKE